jgi:uncharacterized protein (TIGR02444 family)
MDTIRGEPNDFWRFSLRIYRAPGVEQACLALQDGCGADVNLLLFCCWVAQAGRALDKRALRRAMALAGRWQAETVQPLRQVRRTLKNAPFDVPSAWAEELRKRILGVELDLEYLEQRLLFDLAAQLPPVARPRRPAAAAAHSLARYLALLSVPTGPAQRPHVASLLQACCAAPGGNAQVTG